jgi:TctA family transporter
MEILSLLGDGMLLALQPLNLMLILIGVTVGLFIGAMPGLGSVNGVAILLPITFLVPPSGAIIFLAAIYYGAMYGGAISSVTLGIPGASTAVATTFDGRPLARRAVRASRWSRRRWHLSWAARSPTSSSPPSRRCWPTWRCPSARPRSSR